MGVKAQGGGKPKKTSVVVVESKKIQWKRIVGVALLAFILLGGAAWGITAYLSNRHKAQLAAENTCVNEDSGKLLKKAAANFGINNTSNLYGVVHKIQSLNNYSQDPNCLYIIVAYYLNMGDMKNAKGYLSQFNSAYNKTHKLSPVLIDNYETPQALRARISDFSNAVKHNQMNIIPYQVPPQK